MTETNEMTRASIIAAAFAVLAGCGQAHGAPDAGDDDAGVDPPPVEEDAGPPPPDSGVVADASPDADPPMDAGGFGGACVVVAVEDVATGTDACDRASVTTLPGGDLAMAWSHYRHGGKLARRRGGAWDVVPAFGAARRIELDGGHAAVERNGGELSLWRTTPEPSQLERVDGVHTLARGGGLVESPTGPQLLSVHTHEEGGFTWSVHLTVFGDRTEIRHLVDERSVAAWDLAADRDGLPTVLFEASGRLAIVGRGTVPLPEGARMWADRVDSLHAFTPERDARVVVQRRTADGTAVLVARSRGVAWDVDELLRDDPDPCSPAPTEGDTCAFDRTTHRMASMLPTDRPRVLLIERREVGTLEWVCDFSGLRDIPCAWEGDLERVERLLIGSEIALGDYAIEAVDSLVFEDTFGLGVHVSDGRAHLALTDVIEPGSDPLCRITHVELDCAADE